MAADQLGERLAEIRKRFASKLDAKLAATDATLPGLSGEGSAVIDTVATTYRRFHEMCGTAPTLGFADLGRAARVVVTTLAKPFHAQRGLTIDEMTELKNGLEALRAVAQIELQSIKTGGE